MWPNEGTPVLPSEVTLPPTIHAFHENNNAPVARGVA